MGLFSGVGKAFKSVFKGVSGFGKSIFKTAGGLFKSIGGFVKPEIPEIKIPEPAAAPEIKEDAAAVSKEESAAAEAEKRRALAKYGKSTKTLLSGFTQAAAKKLLGE